jgi:vacuolar-type H+-ATPase subunit I/STV1
VVRGYALKFVGAGLFLTALGAFFLTREDKLNPEIHDLGWPLVIAGPGVVVFGIVLWRWDGNGKGR